MNHSSKNKIVIGLIFILFACATPEISFSPEIREIQTLHLSVDKREKWCGNLKTLELENVSERLHVILDRMDRKLRAVQRIRKVGSSDGEKTAQRRNRANGDVETVSKLRGLYGAYLGVIDDMKRCVEKCPCQEPKLPVSKEAYEEAGCPCDDELEAAIAKQPVL